MKHATLLLAVGLVGCSDGTERVARQAIDEDIPGVVRIQKFEKGKAQGLQPVFRAVVDFRNEVGGITRTNIKVVVGKAATGEQVAVVTPF